MGVELHREAWPTIYLKVKELEVSISRMENKSLLLKLRLRKQRTILLWQMSQVPGRRWKHEHQAKDSLMGQARHEWRSHLEAWLIETDKPSSIYRVLVFL